MAVKHSTSVLTTNVAGRPSNLETKLGSWFERTGRTEVLEKAVRVMEWAVRATPSLLAHWNEREIPNVCRNEVMDSRIT